MLQQPFFLPAVLFLAFGLPLALGLVPRNRWYGFRTRRAMADDEGWKRVNRWGGAAICAAALASLGWAFAHPAPAGAQRGFDFANPHLVAFAGPLLLAALVVWLAGRR